MLTHKEPTVHQIAQTQINRDGMAAFLADVGAEDFETDAKSDAEFLIEIAGRLCYRSFKPGLNPNVTRTRKGSLPYIGNILKSGHGSVTEHGTVTFAVTRCTPVMTHELVRHRAGVSPSQVSGRYCRVDSLNFLMPDAFDNAHAAGYLTSEQLAQIEHEANDLLQRIERFQTRLSALTGIDKIKNFMIKKMLTSAFRRFLPYGLETAVIFTSNHRAIRHMIDMRNGIHAEEEIRKVFFDIGTLMKSQFPALYQDMELAEIETEWGTEDVWQFGHVKV